jgi:hypothetical protein
MADWKSEKHIVKVASATPPADHPLNQNNFTSKHNPSPEISILLEDNVNSKYFPHI